ncbi:MAG: T9SS type A sorting domain-containing protein [Ignavibacteriales bacterium]|nr:MAG: T9SS type A sorting domain-containing protein [Ignavibacteriales bacterium]
MKRTVLFMVMLLTGMIYGQAEWKYKGEIAYPVADSLIEPFMVTTDVNGRLYLASSKVTNSRAYNAILYADSGDTVFKMLINFDLNGDSDTLQGNVGAIRGITTIGTDVYINSNIPYPRTAPNTVAAQYRYPNGDTLLVEKFGFGLTGAGYGTYINGLAATKDTILMTGIPFGTSFRFYNFSYGVSTPARGSWVPMATTAPMEPGGPHTGGVDVIRDVATVPGANYNLPETPFYTSRNSVSSTQVTGGIAVWTGGDQLNPSSYTGTRVSDAAGELTFDRAIPYGITVDKNGILWVAGTDTSKRWVKGYTVLINFAQNMYELPSQNDPNNPNAEGAPMTGPSDVALSPDALTAYVADGGSGKVFRFKYEEPTVDVKEEITSVRAFALDQNYPNPFNPSTIISYSLPKETKVRVAVANAIGQEVAVLFEGTKSSGKHSHVFNAAGMTSGIYFYSITTPSGKLTRKMILMK